MVTITVDGRQLQAPKGSLLWEVCHANGITIPIFCYHTKLGPVGACRTCLVEQEGVAKGPITACSTHISDGMVIRTRSAVVEKAQRGIFEFLLANHPLDCPICDRGGECPLQDQTFAFGPGSSRYIEPKRHHVKPIVLGPTIALDRERCVLCWRCVRFCADVAEDKSIVLLDRGEHSMVGTFQDEPYISNFSGNVVELCPVGALTSRKQRFAFRPWELQNRPSVCPHCPMGCNINISVRKNDEVIRFLSRDNPEVDNSWLCDRGRFGFDFINREHRVASPLIRRGDAFEQTSWDEALEFVAGRMQSIVEEHGPESIAGVASPRLTNEDLYVFKQFMSRVIGSQNFDHFPRPAMKLGSDQLAAMARLDRTLGSIEDLLAAKTIVLLGADPSTRAPVLELRIREALNKHGARLLVLGSQQIALSSKASAHITYHDGDFARVTQELSAGVRTGTSSGPDDLAAAITLLADGPVAVIYDDRLTGVSDKGAGVEAIDALVAAIGRTQRVTTLGLLDESNSMGARDLEIFPASQPWDRTIIERLSDRTNPIKAAVVLGADLAAAGDPELVQALRDLELLVVLELKMTDTANLASVVLPATCFAEKRGSLTNLERRIQSISETLPAPGMARPDWEILTDLSNYFDLPLQYTVPEDVWRDIGASGPYRGMGYTDIGPRGTRPGSLQLVT